MIIGISVGGALLAGIGAFFAGKAIIRKIRLSKSTKLAYKIEKSPERPNDQEANLPKNKVSPEQAKVDEPSTQDINGDLKSLEGPI